jgi:hypothetical protein
VEVVSGRLDPALRLIGASRALEQRTGTGLLDLNEELLAAFDADSEAILAAAGMTPEDAERLIEQGSRFSREEAVAYVLEELPDPGALAASRP